MKNIEFRPIAPDQMKDESFLRNWRHKYKQNLEKYSKAKKDMPIVVDVTEKGVDEFTKTIVTYIKDYTKDYKIDVENLLIEEVEEAHNNAYKITKEEGANKNETLFVADDYDKFIDNEYGKNIPGVRQAKKNYG